MAGDCGYKGKGRKGRSGMKKVSVIIPAYRCAATLRQAIDSALFQEVPLEILVLDDCSGGGYRRDRAFLRGRAETSLSEK